ncbi:MAG TPA: MFS transporter [Quisquiliibacterium sp.]|nr:MFS transporter [Quisquiliibacterium sp.]
MTRPVPTAARWFLASIATYMVPNGIQMVLLPTLMAIELNQSAGRFGLTQMIGQLPLLLFLLMGGWIADRVDTRRWLMGVQAAAVVMPLVLAVLLWTGHAGETPVLLWAFAWGLVGAFSMPARDGLLRRVAGDEVQRMVTLALGTQFGMQMLGQALAGQAARWGVVPLLVLQAVVVAVGVFVASRLPPGRVSHAPQAEGLWRGLAGGFALILSTPVLRATYLITIGMGVFFGGVFLVLLPLAVRDLYAGGARDISFAYVAFGLGTLLCIVGLMRRGGARRPGRALLVSQASGCLALLPIAFTPPQWGYLACIFVWGMSGGLAMTMSRTIMQEQSPATHQSRVMAALTLATTGGAPLGALVSGAVIGQWGVPGGVALPIVGVTLLTLASMALHPISRLQSHSHARRVETAPARS